MLLYLKQRCVEGRHNDGEADKGVLSPLGQHLSLPTDVDLLPNMNQLHGLSRDSEGKAIPGQKLGSSPLPAAIIRERWRKGNHPGTGTKTEMGWGVKGKGEHTAKGQRSGAGWKQIISASWTKPCGTYRCPPSWRGIPE